MNVSTFTKPFANFGTMLDQPIAVAKFAKAVPYLLVSSGVAVLATDVYKAKEEDRKKVAIQDSLVLGFTILSAIISAKGVGKFKGLLELESLDDALKKAKATVEEYLSKNQLNDEKLKNIVEKAKSKVLSFKEISYLSEKMNQTEEGKQFLQKLIPEPQNVTSKECFSQIGRLSLLGLIPVVSGITGGVLADKITEDKEVAKKKTANKIKEGFYQFFANIFLCNVGAGAALLIMEQMKVKSKAARAIAMVVGITLTGILGGSAIANWLSARIIDPLFDKEKRHPAREKQHLYAERKPELLDIGLHTDDIATVAVMSGLKWIEPALPFLYSVSGYRSGIGYRNGENMHHHGHHHKHRHCQNVDIEA